MNELGRPIRAISVGAGRAVRGVASIAAVVVVVGVLAFLLAGRGGSTAAPGATPPPIAIAAGAADAVSSVAPSDPGVDAETPSAAPASPSADPILTPTPAPTPDPTARPTARPTPDPTPAPTKRPATATPRPTPDPEPEPTPWLGKASGAFGSTLTAGGVTASLEKRAPSGEPKCGSESHPTYTEAVSFDLRMTWPDSVNAMEPFLAAGAAPYYNVNWFDPSGWQSGVTYVVSTCVRPGDTAKAFIETASNGGPPRTYRFSFH